MDECMSSDPQKLAIGISGRAPIPPVNLGQRTVASPLSTLSEVLSWQRLWTQSEDSIYGFDHHQVHQQRRDKLEFCWRTVV